MRRVLDASALLAALQNEPGAERVGATLDAAVISTVNLAEVVAGLARNGATEKEVRAAISMASVTAIAPDEEMAIDAGLLRAITDKAGLSLGDRFCLALARRLRAPALTADRKWAEVVADTGVPIELIR